MELNESAFESIIVFAYLKGFDDAQIRTRDTKTRTRQEAINDTIKCAYERLNGPKRGE